MSHRVLSDSDREGYVFERTLVAGWGDMDWNSHMANTAYFDKGADVRMMFFAEHGFPMGEFARLKIGPVIFKEEIEYFREIRLLDEVRVTLSLAALSEDGSRFRIRNEFFRPDGKRAARLESSGGWLDLAARKLVVPPAGLVAALRALPGTKDFESLPSSVNP
jgi:acyl-CoA thioester hydrolase